jgi:uncharacterized membrane protein
MDDSPLQNRLDSIEKRQSRIVLLLLFGYVVAGTWLLTEEVAAITAWDAIVALTALGLSFSMVAIYRRRQSRQEY